MKRPGPDGGVTELPLEELSGRRDLVTSPNRTRIRMSPAAYYLLAQVQAGVPFEKLALQFKRDGHQAVSADEVEAAYNRLRVGLDAIELKGDHRPFGYWLRVPVIPEAVVARIATRLSAAFRRPAALALISLMIGIATITAIRGFSLTAPAGTIIAGYGLFLISLLAHELGHASACRRYGARPSAIGFTIYLLFPAFYSDVNAAWELRRSQRVVVDLGGIYLQLVVGALYALGYVLTGWQPLRAAVLIILVSCLFSINPFFKFDGYWMLGDALGVTNLGQQPLRLVRHAIARLRGHAPRALPWGRGVIAFLTAYVVLTSAVWAVFIALVLPNLWFRVTGYPQLLGSGVTEAIRSSRWPTAGRLGALALATLWFLIALVVMAGVARMVIVNLRILARRHLFQVNRNVGPPLQIDRTTREPQGGGSKWDA